MKMVWETAEVKLQIMAKKEGLQNAYLPFPL